MGTKNDLEVSKVLKNIVDYHTYTPSVNPWWGVDDTELYQVWYYVQSSLKRGNVMEAIAAIESDEPDDASADWSKLASCIRHEQPDLARRLWNDLQSPATRQDLLRILLSLADPLTLLRTDCNSLEIDQLYKVSSDVHR